MVRAISSATSELRVAVLEGDAIAAAIGEVARLRIGVFRDWPYLYDGTLDYETKYLAAFARAKDAVVVAAYDAGIIVGAATAAPLAGHTSEFVPLFADAGIDPDRVFYCGESVLLAQYRGHGLGHAFFDHREAKARRSTGAKGRYTHTAFCGVIRDSGDPRAPTGYRPLDGFWRKRGYLPVPGLFGSYSWREIGAAHESEKAMQFWMRPL